MLPHIPGQRKIFLGILHYISREKIWDLRESCCLSKNNENLVRVVACELDEPICKDESCDCSGPFCFFYDTVFIKLCLYLPLTVFEKEILTELNVSPAQLHPNSWAFIRAFVIFCSQFGISLTLNIFFSISLNSKAPTNSCGLLSTVVGEEIYFPSFSLRTRISKDVL